MTNFYLTEQLHALVEMNNAQWVVDEIERMYPTMPVLHDRVVSFLILQKDFEKDIQIQYYEHATNDFRILPPSVHCAFVVSDPETFDILYTKRFSAMSQPFTLTPWQIFIKNNLMMTLGEWIYGDSKKRDADTRS